jgi:hypothetical protein
MQRIQGTKSENLDKLWAEALLESDLEEVLLPEARLQDSELSIYGQQPKSVRIVDKRVRAFDLSRESEEALQAALTFDRRSDYCWCKDAPTRITSVFYAFYLLALKQTGSSKTRCSNLTSTSVFAICLTIDFVLTSLFMLHLCQPDDLKLMSLGIPFLMILPAIAVLSPLIGMISCLTAS